MASAFPEFYVTPINVPKKVVHLKSCVSMAGPGILCVSSSPEAQEILRVRLFTVSFVCGNIYDNSAVLTSLFLFVFIYSVLHRKRLSPIRPLPYRTMSRLILYTLMAL